MCIIFFFALTHLLQRCFDPFSDGHGQCSAEFFRTRFRVLRGLDFGLRACVGFVTVCIT